MWRPGQQAETIRLRGDVLFRRIHKEKQIREGGREMTRKEARR